MDTVRNCPAHAEAKMKLPLRGFLAAFEFGVASDVQQAAARTCNGWREVDLIECTVERGYERLHVQLDSQLVTSHLSTHPGGTIGTQGEAIGSSNVD